MDAFEREIEQDMAQRFDEGHEVGREVAALRCVEIAMEMQCEAVASVIRCEFGLENTEEIANKGTA